MAAVPGYRRTRRVRTTVWGCGLGRWGLLAMVLQSPCPAEGPVPAGPSFAGIAAQVSGCQLLDIKPHRNRCRLVVSPCWHLDPCGMRESGRFTVRMAGQSVVVHIATSATRFRLTTTQVVVVEAWLEGRNPGQGVPRQHIADLQRLRLRTPNQRSCHPGAAGLSPRTKRAWGMGTSVRRGPALQ